MLYVDEYSFIISAIEFLGAMMCTVVLVMDMSHRFDSDKNTFRLIRGILAFAMISSTFDGVSYLFDLNVFENAILINNIIIFIDFISYLLAFYLTYIFIINSLPSVKDNLKSPLRRIVSCLIFVDLLMLFTNPFTNFVYVVDENNEYIKNFGMNIHTGILFLIAITLIVIVLAAMKNFQKGESLPLLISLFILISGGVWELVLEDFPGTNIAISIVSLLIYIVYRTKYILKKTSITNRYILMVMYLFFGMTIAIFCTFMINVSAIMSVTKENTEKTSETVANMINQSVVNLFIKPITVSETMAQSSNLKSGILRDSQMDINSTNYELVDYLSSIRDGRGYQMVFAVSNYSKKFYTYNGISKIVDTENDEHDVWYTEFLEMDKPYDLKIDTDEANDWATSVFVNTRVENDKGELLAVCGVGVSMDVLIDLIAGYEEEYGVEIYLVDHDGLVQVASNGENIETLELDNTYFDQVNSKVFYYERLEDSCRLTKYDESLDWYIVVVDDNPDKISVAEVIRPGLFASIISIILMLVAYFGINWNDIRIKRVLVENKNRAEYLKKMSETDELTKLFNRHAYENVKRQFKNSELNDDFTIMIMDINGLKSVNDNIGHDAGDELIKGAAECIVSTYDSYGTIYRVGGDEFALILNISEEDIKLINDKFRNATMKWQGKKVKELAVSLGYACHADYKNLSFDELVKVADEQMYEDKRNYYKRTGKERRSN